ncbi:MAG: ABC transporter substrate-binding protein [Synechococcales bacterium]|nr:ABC transporter substrate-binding protein [Synechococcales bacterium]
MGAMVNAVLRWIISLGICLLLTACQGTSADQALHLTLWHGVNPPPNRDVLDRLVAQFNQTHPGIVVEPLYVGQADQQLPKILAAIVGNAAPDMLWYAPMLTGQLVELEALRSLDDWLPTIPENEQIEPALRSSMELEGKTWSIPFDTNNVGIFYRPSLFKAAGIDAFPTTWAELRAVAKRLTRDRDGDGKIDQQGMLLPLGKGEWTVFTWLPFFWSSGGDLQPANPATQPTARPIVLNQPAAAQALTLWQQLLQDGSAILSQPERGYDLTGFIQGKVAMQLSGPWTLAELNQSGVDYAVMPIPQDQQPATVIGGENLFLFKSNPAREAAALQFAQTVLSQDFQTAWATQTGYLPVNIRSQENPTYQAFLSQQPALSTFLTQAKQGRSRPIAPGYNRLSDTLGRAIETVLLNQTTPNQALQTAQTRIKLLFGQTR